MRPMIRPAEPGDGAWLGKMAASLVRLHHSLDPERFFLQEPLEEGYANYLLTRVKDPNSVVLVAEREGQAVGYLYAGIEPRDWYALLDRHGAIHDIWVEPSARRFGIASALMKEGIARLESIGAPRIVLSTAARNEGGQAFFQRLGFRPTMIELCRERGQDPSG